MPAPRADCKVNLLTRDKCMMMLGIYDETIIEDYQHWSYSMIWLWRVAWLVSDVWLLQKLKYGFKNWIDHWEIAGGG